MKFDKKSLFLVFGLFAALANVYALGAVDNVVAFTARHADDVARAVARTVPDIIKPGLSHGDDIVRAGVVHADDLARLTLHHADDVARLGLRQGDDLIYNFPKVHLENSATYRYIPRTRGMWDNIPGDSIFFPDLNHIPSPGKQLNEMYFIPKTWKEIGEQNIRQIQNLSDIPLERRLELADNYKRFSSGEIGFKYKQGEIDFSSFAYDTVDVRTVGYDRIPEWRYTRDDPLRQGRPGLMDVGDTTLAQKWNWSPEEVRAFMQNYGLTWHERMDMQTLDLVPVDMHLISHRGGHSVVNALLEP